MLAHWPSIWLPLTLALSFNLLHAPAQAQDRRPWEPPPQRTSPPPNYDTSGDVYRPGSTYGGSGGGDTGGYRPGGNDAYRPNNAYGQGPVRDVAPPPGSGGGPQPYDGGQRYSVDPDYRDGSRSGGYGREGYGGYQAGEPYDRGYGGPPPPGAYGEGPPPGYDRTYSRNEVLETGHKFFGSVSKGLASVIEYAFQQAGRPNGYILGEDAGGAFVAGLRYGEGTLYTKDAGQLKVYWQGPSVGYDFGGEGSKTMVLVYNLRDPYEIFDRFAGVQGSAYVVGGVGIQFQKNGDVTLAPIRSGLGLRLGANIGYLKYTRSPTWNPF